jgi:hypothetical protein
MSAHLSDDGHPPPLLAVCSGHRCPVCKGTERKLTMPPGRAFVDCWTCQGIWTLAELLPPKETLG